MSDDPEDGEDDPATGGRPPAADDGDATVADDQPLAAVVEKPRSEAVIAALREEAVYDDSRRVREYGPETVALPVTEPPRETRVLEVVRQIDPERRSRDLADYLAERGWSDDELAAAPASWAVVGSVVLVSIPDGLSEEMASDVGDALLELHGEAESVLADEGIENEGEAGTHRRPRTRHLAGSTNTETIHVEHGTRYGLDPTEVMFSPGNQAERARMGEVVSPGERVFDMFAGIGYFTLPMARAGASVTATEINPTAFRYLLENAMLNDVAGRVDAYMTDCRDLAGEIEADRIVMGYYGSGGGADAKGGAGRADEAHEFLPAALEALSDGGVIHYHEATPESRLWERPLERLETAIGRTGRSFEVRERRRIKSHSAGVAHVVVDVRLD